MRASIRNRGCLYKKQGCYRLGVYLAGHRSGEDHPRSGGETVRVSVCSLQVGRVGRAFNAIICRLSRYRGGEGLLDFNRLPRQSKLLEIKAISISARLCLSGLFLYCQSFALDNRRPVFLIVFRYLAFQSFCRAMHLAKQSHYRSLSRAELIAVLIWARLMQCLHRSVFLPRAACILRLFITETRSVKMFKWTLSCKLQLHKL